MERKDISGLEEEEGENPRVPVAHGSAAEGEAALGEMTDLLSQTVSGAEGESRDTTEPTVSEIAVREKEELFRTILNATIDGILVVDPQGRISYMNRRFLEMWRIPPELVQGADARPLIAFVLFQLEDPDGFQARIIELDAGSDTIHDEIGFKDGRIFERYSSPILVNGEIKGRLQAFRDIIIKKRSEEALRASEERYREIFNATSEGIFIQDAATGAILDANEAALRMFGFDSVAEIQNSNIAPMTTDTPGFTREEALEKLRMAVQGHPQIFEWLSKRRSGESFCVEVSLKSSSIMGKNTVLAVGREITERKRAEQDMRLIQYGVDRARDGVFWLDSTARLIYVNETACRSLGYSREELLSMKISDIDPDFPPGAWPPHLEEIRLRGSVTFESRHRTKDGRIFPVEVTSNYVFFEGQEGSFASARDITDRKQGEVERERLQAQLTQAQKMESIGRLAGGVAHDFNNMLAVITGYAELALRNPDVEGVLRQYLEAILSAGRHSADLVGQLLAFARKQIIAPKVLDLNRVVEGMFKMLRRLLGEDIDLIFMPEKELWSVQMDPGQIDQILANICVNARDAIDGKMEEAEGSRVVGGLSEDRKDFVDGRGTICIETANVILDEAYVTTHEGVIPGEYVGLTVSDNGRGMEKDTIARVFEPFFTTKDLGQGTGLGLATVYGIVKQNNGYINAYSEPGQGTTFTIYVPRHKSDVSEKDVFRPEDIPHGHGETILVVEDEPSLLEVTETMLVSLGYLVLAAATPEKAMRLLSESRGKADLLITDVIMPGMNGKELAERLRAIKPGMPCLYVSGYTANVIAHHGILDEGVHFIQKPFSVVDLATKVKVLLRKQ